MEPKPLNQLLSQRPLTPISSSIQELDHCLNGGFVPSQIYEVSSLNGCGKFQFIKKICQNGLKMNKKVLWISCLKQVENNLWNGDDMTNIRIDSIAKLFIYLQCYLKNFKFELIIIEDLSIILNKNYNDLNDLLTEKISNHKKRINFIEIKKNQSLLKILKLLKSYSISNKSSIVLVNPLDSTNMSFIETDEQPSSSSSFLSSQFNKKKLFNQQILKSSLGDNTTWSFLLRARLLLYKDWYYSKVAIFINVQHNLSIKKFLNLNNRPICFEIESNGEIKELEHENDESIKTIENDSQPFVLNEEDFDSEEQEEKDQEEETILHSSPHIDIRNVKDILNESYKSSQNVLEEINEKNEENKGNGNENDEDTKEEREEYEENDEYEEETNVEEETNIEEEGNMEEEISIEETNIEVENRKLHEINETIDITLDSIMTESKLTVETNTEHNDFNDNDYEQELDDELEELYPTQKQTLTLNELTTLSQSFNLNKRRKIDELDLIPSSAPLF